MAEHRSKLPPSFDGESDFHLWSQQFDVWAAAQELDDAAQLRSFPTFLTGPAFGFYSELPVATKANLTLIRQAMAGPFGRPVFLEEFRRAANARPRHPGESLPVYAAEIRRLVRLAYPTYNDAARAGVALDRFLAGLDPDLKYRVMGFGPADVDAAVRQATLCEEVRTSAARDAQAYPSAARVSVGPSDRDLATTVASLATQLAEVVDLLKNQAVNRSSNQRSRPPPVSNSSPADRRREPSSTSQQRRRRSVPADAQCYRCHGYGHFEAACPTPSGNGL
ncbi:PREDICTED: uncharacterized protein LOC109467312 [Branchiostoma belcheri]|uniref:Uncharacterized protein LOC109467312 n=1 Tax=Branchiostoma belcheri TaxID=7741 RepID=A0A6P4XVY1_BRABE|nr:PREDICTED: uncharacterized protein LOC109467312 [Branchiostoma belcheri]